MRVTVRRNQSVEIQVSTFWKSSQSHFVLNWTFSCFIHSLLFQFLVLSLCTVIGVFHVFIYRIYQTSDFRRQPKCLTVNSKDSDPFHRNNYAILVFWHLYTKLYAFGEKNYFPLPTVISYVCRFDVFILTCSVVFGRLSNCPTNVQRVRQWAEPVLLCVICINLSLSKGKSVKKW